MLIFRPLMPRGRYEAIEEAKRSERRKTIQKRRSRRLSLSSGGIPPPFLVKFDDEPGSPGSAGSPSVTVTEATAKSDYYWACSTIGFKPNYPDLNEVSIPVLEDQRPKMLARMELQREKEFALEAALEAAQAADNQMTTQPFSAIARSPSGRSVARAPSGLAGLNGKARSSPSKGRKKLAGATASERVYSANGLAPTKPEEDDDEDQSTGEPEAMFTRRPSHDFGLSGSQSEWYAASKDGTKEEWSTEEAHKEAKEEAYKETKEEERSKEEGSVVSTDGSDPPPESPRSLPLSPSSMPRSPLSLDGMKRSPPHKGRKKLFGSTPSERVYSANGLALQPPGLAELVSDEPLREGQRPKTIVKVESMLDKEAAVDAGESLDHTAPEPQLPSTVARSPSGRSIARAPSGLAGLDGKARSSPSKGRKKLAGATASERVYSANGLATQLPDEDGSITEPALEGTPDTNVDDDETMADEREHEAAPQRARRGTRIESEGFSIDAEPKEPTLLLPSTLVRSPSALAAMKRAPSQTGLAGGRTGRSPSKISQPGVKRNPSASGLGGMPSLSRSASGLESMPRPSPSTGRKKLSGATAPERVYSANGLAPTKPEQGAPPVMGNYMESSAPPPPEPPREDSARRNPIGQSYNLAQFEKGWEDSDWAAEAASTDKEGSGGTDKGGTIFGSLRKSILGAFSSPDATPDKTRSDANDGDVEQAGEVVPVMAAAAPADRACFDVDVFDVDVETEPPAPPIETVRVLAAPVPVSIAAPPSRPSPLARSPSTLAAMKRTPSECGLAGVTTGCCSQLALSAVKRSPSQSGLAGAKKAPSQSAGLAGAKKAPSQSAGLAGAKKAPSQSVSLAGAKPVAASQSGLAGAKKAPSQMSLEGAARSPSQMGLTGAARSPSSKGRAKLVGSTSSKRVYSAHGLETVGPQ